MGFENSKNVVGSQIDKPSIKDKRLTFVTSKTEVVWFFSCHILRLNTNTQIYTTNNNHIKPHVIHPVTTLQTILPYMVIFWYLRTENETLQKLWIRLSIENGRDGTSPPPLVRFFDHNSQHQMSRTIPATYSKKLESASNIKVQPAKALLFITFLIHVYKLATGFYLLSVCWLLQIQGLEYSRWRNLWTLTNYEHEIRQKGQPFVINMNRFDFTKSIRLIRPAR